MERILARLRPTSTRRTNNGTNQRSTTTTFAPPHAGDGRRGRDRDPVQLGHSECALTDPWEKPEVEGSRLDRQIQIRTASTDVH